MAWLQLLGTVLQALVPLGVKIAERALAGDADPFATVLGDSVARTIESPMKSRVALEAAKAQDEARKRGGTP